MKRREASQETAPTATLIGSGARRMQQERTSGSLKSPPVIPPIELEHTSRFTGGHILRVQKQVPKTVFSGPASFQRISGSDGHRSRGCRIRRHGDDARRDGCTEHWG